MSTTLIYVLYDSINQAVFEGQVFLPLIARLTKENYSQVVIISFEQKLTEQVKQQAQEYNKKDPRIHITLFKRSHFIHPLLLRPLVQKLRKELQKHGSYQLLARGPFAGLVARKAITKECQSLTIQARGLAVEEYRYTHQRSSGLKKLVHCLRQQQLFVLEKLAYQKAPKKLPFFIEAVSPALQEYLMLTYQTPTKVFKEAQFDCPTPIDATTKKTWRTAKRTELQISPDAPVYLYNGSLKPWQCPEETIALFKKEWEQDPTALFIAITPDKEAMEELLKNYNLSESSYRVLSVKHTEVASYVCAADYGLLLREEHLMNWVSRPTKLLEYQAAGLEVIHNNTVQLLTRI